jgi:hypothetical protein
LRLRESPWPPEANPSRAINCASTVDLPSHLRSVPVGWHGITTTRQGHRVLPQLTWIWPTVGTIPYRSRGSAIDLGAAASIVERLCASISGKHLFIGFAFVSAVGWDSVLGDREHSLEQYDSPAPPPPCLTDPPPCSSGLGSKARGGHRSAIGRPSAHPWSIPERNRRSKIGGWGPYHS